MSLDLLLPPDLLDCIHSLNYFLTIHYYSYQVAAFIHGYIIANLA